MMDEATTRFWNFSVAVYKQPGVQDECLALQESLGLDVNLLLFCAYAGAIHGAALDKNDIETISEVAGEWHENVVRALRHARKALKPWALKPELHFGAAANMLRVQVKREELEAERIEHAILAHWMALRDGKWQLGDRAEAAASNIRLLLDHYRATGKTAEPPPQFIAAVISQAGR